MTSAKIDFRKFHIPISNDKVKNLQNTIYEDGYIHGSCFQSDMASYSAARPLDVTVSIGPPLCSVSGM